MPALDLGVESQQVMHPQYHRDIMMYGYNAEEAKKYVMRT